MKYFSLYILTQNVRLVNYNFNNYAYAEDFLTFIALDITTSKVV